MVRDHHRRAVVRLREAGLQPVRMPAELGRARLRREQRIVVLLQPDALEVAHETGRGIDGHVAFRPLAEQAEVGPQGRAEETHALQVELAVIEQVDGAARAQLARSARVPLRLAP
ncbi:hypothetical protein [Ramlibacter montanisoli]|uniref:hypothetical protein n=1 Tax=Ramlibacter montanisoli TaxID=2732512 RepID=UPI0028155A8A|nr:hypothetical protein [Ramlibacter montanisoli]